MCLKTSKSSKSSLRNLNELLKPAEVPDVIKFKEELKFLIQSSFSLPWLFMVGLSCAITWVDQSGYINEEWRNFMSESKSAIGFAGAFLSFALVFRTNVCYSRWWEGRCLWGAMITNSFDASQQASRWIHDRELATRFQNAIILFGWSAKSHLRDNKLSDEGEEGQNLISRQILTEAELDAIVNQGSWQPYYCLDVMRAVADLALRNDNVSSEAIKMAAMRSFEDSIKGLSAGINGANRVKTTGLPVSYNLFLLSFLHIFFTFATIAWAPTIGWYTPVVVGSIFLVAMMIVYLGDAMENPFGTDLSDLPLNKYCRGIEQHVKNVKANYLAKFDLANGPGNHAVSQFDA